MGLSRTVSEINGDFRIFYPCVFNTPAEGDPLEFCNGGRLKKNLERSPIRMSKSVTICALHSFRHIGLRERTGRRMELAITMSPSVCIAC